ncbi:MAG: tetratricopeptide repeat protein [Candidatus Kapaibacterium sp.]
MNNKEKNYENPEEQGEGTLQEEEAIDTTKQIVQKYRTIVIAVSLAIVIIAGLIFYMQSRTDEAAVEASAHLSKVLPHYNANDYEIALNGGESENGGGKFLGLKEIADRYDNEQGNMAALYTGRIYLHNKDYENAEKYFSKAEGADARITKMGAKAGFAASEEGKGNYSEAASLYEEAFNLAEQDMVKSRYKYFAAYANERAGDKEKAISLYRDIIASDEYSEFAAYAKSGLVRLGMKIE